MTGEVPTEGLAAEAPTDRRLRAMVHEALGPVTDDKVSVNGYDVQRALQCHASCTASSEYRDTALMARRRLGLHALEMLQSSPRPITPLQAVLQAMEDPPDTLDQWIIGLDDGGRAAVAREALVLVHGLRTQLPWPPKGSLGHQPLNWPASTTIMLKARTDGLARPRQPGRTDQVVLLTAMHPGHAPSERVLAHHTALVYGLMYRVPPRSVKVRCLATGTGTTYRIDAAAVDDAIAAAGTAAAAKARVLTGRTAGTHCVRCTLQHSCAEAASWRTSTGVRIGGLRSSRPNHVT